jgi:hypothetical protein
MLTPVVGFYAATNVKSGRSPRYLFVIKHDNYELAYRAILSAGFTMLTITNEEVVAHADCRSLAAAPPQMSVDLSLHCDVLHRDKTKHTRGVPNSTLDKRHHRAIVRNNTNIINRYETINNKK